MVSRLLKAIVIVVSSFLLIYTMYTVNCYTTIQKAKAENVLERLKYQQIKLDKTTRELKSLRHEYDYTVYQYDKTFTAIETIFLKLPDYIEAVAKNEIKIDKVTKRILEEKLRFVNIFLTNKTIEATGSGVTIKYKGEFYILTAGHMIEEESDEIWLSENGVDIVQLELIKVDHTNDLALFKSMNSDIVPRIYVEIAEQEPFPADEIYIVGNPMGFEDTLTEGRIMFYAEVSENSEPPEDPEEGTVQFRQEAFMYFLGTSYFGNSGGGVFNKEGKLVGIVSHLVPIRARADVDFYTINGATRLNEIKEFLKEI
jgi:S1-C subfamily serine protease